MTRTLYARAAGAGTPTNDEAPADGTARGFRNQEQDASLHFHAIGVADQAALIIEGGDYGREYLERMRAGIAQPDELAVIVAFLRDGPVLNGFCRAIEKALGVPHA